MTTEWIIVLLAVLAISVLIAIFLLGMAKLMREEDLALASSPTVSVARKLSVDRNLAHEGSDDGMIPSDFGLPGWICQRYEVDLETPTGKRNRTAQFRMSMTREQYQALNVGDIIPNPKYVAPEVNPGTVSVTAAS